MGKYMYDDSGSGEVSDGSEERLLGIGEQDVLGIQWHMAGLKCVQVLVHCRNQKLRQCDSTCDREDL
jgi:hypothetical protein